MRSARIQGMSKQTRYADTSPTPEFVAELHKMMSPEDRAFMEIQTKAPARQKIYDALVAIAADADRAGDEQLWKAACEALAATGKAWS